MLGRCWHPVAYGHEVAEAPHGTDLLGEALVLWRSSDRRVHAMRDLCIHRGTALSLGWVADDCLVCPYHAWRYDVTGACVRIPQSKHATIPAKARTPAYRCQERYGLIWVCLAESPPAYALPEMPELESPAWKVVKTGPFAWATNASRQVENFTDFGHFPWVHPGLLGDPSRPVVPDHHVETRGHVLHYEVVRPEAANSDDFRVFANAQTDQPVRRSRYELHLPYTIALRLGWGGEQGMVYFFASQPLDANRCRGYCVIGRNYDLDDPDETLQKFEDVIFGQDQRVVESQRPEQVPFDLADELHLQFDAVAIAYRKAMQREGLAATPRSS
jgi:vanillate O-demethylase monooxygenase subunit